MPEWRLEDLVKDIGAWFGNLFAWVVGLAATIPYAMGVVAVTRVLTRRAPPPAAPVPVAAPVFGAAPARAPVASVARSPEAEAAFVFLGTFALLLSGDVILACARHLQLLGQVDEGLDELSRRAGILWFLPPFSAWMWLVPLVPIVPLLPRGLTAVGHVLRSAPRRRLPGRALRRLGPRAGHDAPGGPDLRVLLRESDVADAFYAIERRKDGEWRTVRSEHVTGTPPHTIARVPGGAIRVKVVAPGRGWASTDPLHSAGGEATVAIALAPGRAVRGRATNSLGEPLRVTVRVADWPVPAASSGDDGVFTLPDVPRFAVRVAIERVGFTTLDLPVAAEGDDLGDLILRPES
jgi:hypothetical protein